MAHDKYYTEQAILYAYGELEDSKEKAFLRHLETCRACQTTLDAITLTSSAIETVEAPKLNTRKILHKSIFWSIKNWFKEIKFSRRVLWGAAAACCVAVLVSVFYPKHTQSEGYMYFSDSIYAQIGNVEADIDTLLEDINSL